MYFTSDNPLEPVSQEENYFSLCKKLQLNCASCISKTSISRPQLKASENRQISRDKFRFQLHHCKFRASLL